MEQHIPTVSRRTQPRAINATPVVLALIGILAGVHLLTWLNWQPAVEVLAGLAFVPRFFLALLQGERVYQPLLIALSPLGHSLLHVGLMHLVMNSAFLLAFGTPIERRLGPVRFLLLYALGAIGGAAAVLATHLVMDTDVMVLGASGAVSALFGAIVRGTRQYQATIVGVFVALNLVMGYVGFPSGAQIQNIAWDAHLGGFFTGYLLIPLLVGLRRR